MVYFRGREDPVNSIIAGFSTGFVLAIRGGFRNAVRSGIVGGLLLGIIEIMMVMYGQKAKREEVEAVNKQIMQYKREMARRAKMMNRGEDKPMVDTANRL